MAKCIGSITNWELKIDESHEAAFLVENVRDGEQSIHKTLEETGDLILDIANDYNLIKLSAQSDGDKWDCTQVQDKLINKLNKLGTQITSATRKLCTSNLISSTKHRYFVLFSCGVIEKLKQLLQIVGRLSELDQKLYLEEQNKPLVSEESIIIHSLTTIWLAVISMMQSFIEPAREIFKEQLDSQEYSFLEQLEFATTGPKYLKLQLMDMIITSWIQFNRLVKYEDLLKKLPLICPCHCKTYISTLENIRKNEPNQNFLAQLLPLMLDYRSKPSFMTQSAHQHEIIPQEPSYKDSDQTSLAYFTLWHLYSLSRIIGDTNKHFLDEFEQLIEDSFEITVRQFLPPSQQATVQLSPHQEERFKLIFVMLDQLCEKNPKRLLIIKVMLSFFDKNWTIFEKHFDNPHFRIEGFTVFQLLTRLLNDAQLLYNKEGQAIVNATQDTTSEEKAVNEIWSRILARRNPPPPPPQTTTAAPSLCT